MSLRLPSCMDVAHARALQRALVAELERGEAILELDAQDVVSLDVAGLQLLLSAQVAAAARGRGFHLLRVSPIIRHLLLVSGALDRLLPV